MESLTLLFLLLLLMFLANTILTKVVLKLTTAYKMVEIPNSRSEHVIPKSRLGGIAMAITLLLFMPIASSFLSTVPLLFLPITLILITGLLDDLKGLSPRIKLIFQMGTGLLIYFAGFEISNLHGLFSIYHLAPGFSLVITVLFTIITINAFNLIDGIDGLASMIALINGMLLLYVGIINSNDSGLLLGVILIALYSSFLIYNYYPSLIFMGDTGSMLSGTLCAIGTIVLWNISEQQSATFFNYDSLAIAIVFIPLADILRVFMIRIIAKLGPFKADKRHIHHILTMNLFNHEWATVLIVIVHLSIIVASSKLNNLPVELVLGIMVVAFVLAILLFISLRYFVLSKIRKTVKKKLGQIKSPNPFYKNNNV